LNKRGYLRSELRVKKGEEGRVNSEYVIENVRKVTDAFNKFSLVYGDKEKQSKILELSKSYGLTAENLRYVYFLEMISVFLQNIEAFRAFLLFIMKLPVPYFVKGKRKTINEKTTLGPLLKGLKESGIMKANTLNDIDYNLRNGLSHCLFWLEEQGDLEHSKPHLHYSKDITFKEIEGISIVDFHSKIRKQAIYTLCLLYKILDWFALSTRNIV